MMDVTPAEVRRLMRQGFDTIDIADWLNRMGLFAANQNRAWREPDVWNLLARERPSAPSMTWAYGLCVAASA